MDTPKDLIQPTFMLNCTRPTQSTEEISSPNSLLIYAMVLTALRMQGLLEQVQLGSHSLLRMKPLIIPHMISQESQICQRQGKKVVPLETPLLNHSHNCSSPKAWQPVYLVSPSTQQSLIWGRGLSFSCQQPMEP